MRGKSGWRRRVGAVAVGALVAPLPAACGGGSASATPTLNWYIGKETWRSTIVDACNKQASGRYRVKVVVLPTNPDQQREQLVRRLAAQDTSIDIIGMDVIWTAEFAEAGWLRPYSDSERRELSQDVLAGPLRSATYAGKLYGGTLNSNTQLLWYRKSKLGSNPVPTTWDQMIDEAVRMGMKVQQTGKRAESITVTFNSLLASAGGSFIDNPDAGTAAKVALPQEPTAKAVGVLKKLAKSPAAAPALANSGEDDIRLAFQDPSSGSLFMLNWPFVYPSAQKADPKLAADYGWARWPGVNQGEKSRPPLGGYNLGVSTYSKHPDLAVDAVRCLRSPANQKVIAVQGGQPPTLASLFDDPEYKKTQPFGDILREQLQDAAPRPVTPAYNDISLATQRELHPFRDIGDPESKARSLRDLVSKALKSEAVL